MMDNSEPLLAFPPETADESGGRVVVLRDHERAAPAKSVETNRVNSASLPKPALGTPRRLHPAAMSPAAAVAALAVIGGFSALFLQPVESVSIVVSPPPPAISTASPPAATIATLNPPETAQPLPRREARPVRQASLPFAPFGTGAFNGEMVIQSEPGGASILVNQRSIGVTPLRVQLPATSYAVWVERDGYRRWTAGISVPAGKLTRVEAKLQPDPEVINMAVKTP